MIVDCDAHFTPQFYGPITETQWHKDFVERKSRYSYAVERYQEMSDSLGVDVQILNPTGKSLNLYYSLEKSVAVEVMQAYNNTMSEMCTIHPYYDFNLWLALQDPESCVEEIHKYKDQCFSVYANDIVYWGFADNMEPIWEALNKTGVPFYIHFSGEYNNIHSTIPDKFKDICSQFAQTPWQISLASMILGGVFNRYPHLRLVVAERDITWVNDFREKFLTNNVDDPMDVIKQNVWFTIEPESDSFINDASNIGFDRLLFATDWPHNDPGAANALKDVDTVKELNISQKHKDQIFYQNYFYLKNREGL